MEFQDEDDEDNHLWVDFDKKKEYIILFSSVHYPNFILIIF